MPLKILTQNVCKWRTPDIQGFCNFLLHHNADIYCFTEHLDCAAAQAAKSIFTASGYTWHYETLSSSGRKGSILTISKSSLCEHAGLINCDEGWRFKSFELSEYYLSVVYWPNSYAKAPYWQSLLEYVSRHNLKPHIIIGDFNTGQNDLDKSDAGVPFVVTEYLDQLTHAGYVDAWRHKHGYLREYSWYSNAGNGFRLDHAFISAPLVSKINECYYDHIPRERKYSDHSSLWLTL